MASAQLGPPLTLEDAAEVLHGTNALNAAKTLSPHCVHCLQTRRRQHLRPQLCHSSADSIAASPLLHSCAGTTGRAWPSPPNLRSWAAAGYLTTAADQVAQVLVQASPLAGKQVKQSKKYVKHVAQQAGALLADSGLLVAWQRLVGADLPQVGRQPCWLKPALHAS